MNAPNTNPSPSRIWAAKQQDLAAWTQQHLVNRDDVYGAYYQTAEGVRPCTAPPREERSPGVVTAALLAAHFRADGPGQVVGLHAAGTDHTAKWLALDFDDHDGADAGLILRAALRCRDRLKDDGFPSLILNSNGAGGIHLWTAFTPPAPLDAVHRYSQDVAAEAVQAGLSSPPEANPKQATLKAGGYGNWVRLPGRHHTRPAWSRAWLGNEWAGPEATIDAILNLPQGDPARLPAVQLPIPIPTRSNHSKESKRSSSWFRGQLVALNADVRSSSSGATGLGLTVRVNEVHDGFAWHPIPPMAIYGVVWRRGRDGEPLPRANEMLETAFGFEALKAGLKDPKWWPVCQVHAQRVAGGGDGFHALAFRHADHPSEPEKWLAKATPRDAGGDRGAQLINFAKWCVFDVGLSKDAAWRWAEFWNTHHVLTPLSPDRLLQTFNNAVEKQYGSAKLRAEGGEA